MGIMVKPPGIGESGQGLMQFAMVFGILMLLLSMAVDVARVIDAKIMLQSAACESIRQVSSRESMVSEVNTVLANYYDRLNKNALTADLTAGKEIKRDYTYHANTHERDRNGKLKFVSQNSYIKYFNASIILTYDIPIVTPVGQLVLGKKLNISSKFGKMVRSGDFSWQ